MRRRGFTLLEVMLVVLVIGVSIAAILPAALHTADNARTRSALRDVIALNRHARNLALLERRAFALVYEAPQMRLIALPASGEVDPARILGTEPALPESGTEGNVSLLRTRSLPKFVRIESVEGGAREGEATFVIYTPGGTTDPHTVALRGADGELVHVRVRGISGEIDLVN